MYYSKWPLHAYKIWRIRKYINRVHSIYLKGWNELNIDYFHRLFELRYREFTQLLEENDDLGEACEILNSRAHQAIITNGILKRFSFKISRLLKQLSNFLSKHLDEEVLQTDFRSGIYMYIADEIKEVDLYSLDFSVEELLNIYDLLIILKPEEFLALVLLLNINEDKFIYDTDSMLYLMKAIYGKRGVETINFARRSNMSNKGLISHLLSNSPSLF